MSSIPPEREENLSSAQRKGILKNFKFDAVAFALVLFALLYGGAALAMQTPLPLAPIASGSMEPAIGQGDLALVKRVAVETVEKGDVIVFTIPSETRPAGYPAIRLAHRVVRVEKDPAAGLVFWTKGDALEAIDPFGTPSRLVQGKVVYSVPILGHLWLFFQSRPGITFSGLVVLLLVIYQVEKPVRVWGKAIASGKITDPDLLEVIKMLEEGRIQDRQVVADFTEQMRVHLSAIQGIATAGSELTEGGRELREAAQELTKVVRQINGGSRRNKKRRRRK